jgi:multidrug resistance efflux pump
MACITQSTRTRLEARLAVKEAQLAEADTAYSAALTEVKEYRLNTGEGTQQMEYRDLKGLEDTITRLEAQIEAIYRRLSGKGLVNFTLRRKINSGYTSVVAG